MLTRNIGAVLAVLVMVLLVAAFSAQAYEYSESAHAPVFYTGTIVGIDPVYKILTIQAGPSDASYFTLRDDAAVTMCHKNLSFNDLKIGETVTVSFYEESLGGTKYVTDVETAMKC